VVVDPEAAVELLSPLLSGSRWFGASRPKVVVCTPSNVTEQERERVAECVIRAGAASVTMVPEPVAAAVGAGIDIGSGRASFIVDIGDAVTECAVIQRGRVVRSYAVRLGCGDLRRRLRQCAKQAANLEVNETEAERLLRSVGFQSRLPGKTECVGLRRGRVCEQKLARKAMHEALRPMLSEILRTVTMLLRELPPAMAIEVIEDGIYLTGGGALLQGVREYFAYETRVDVHVVQDPLGAVVKGARAMLPFVDSTSGWSRSVR
jgi:rod shape-determining protein MreB